MPPSLCRLLWQLNMRHLFSLSMYYTEVEEYDPTQPLVSLSAPASQESNHEAMDVDDEPYDPIVSAYSMADAETLNAEDAPGMCFSSVKLSVLCLWLQEISPSNYKKF